MRPRDSPKVTKLTRTELELEPRPPDFHGRGEVTGLCLHVAVTTPSPPCSVRLRDKKNQVGSNVGRGLGRPVYVSEQLTRVVKDTCVPLQDKVNKRCCLSTAENHQHEREKTSPLAVSEIVKGLQKDLTTEGKDPYVKTTHRPNRGGQRPVC